MNEHFSMDEQTDNAMFLRMTMDFLLDNAKWATLDSKVSQLLGCSSLGELNGYILDELELTHGEDAVRVLLCSICLDFLFEPLTLKCRHSFCRLCLLQASRLAPDGGACPQCRAEISFDPKTHALDQGLAAKIEEAVPPDELEARRAHTTATLEKMAAANSGPYPLFVMRGSERGTAATFGARPWATAALSASPAFE